MSSGSDENLALSFLQAAGRNSAAPAIRAGERTIAHDELDASIAAAAASLLSAGVRPGDRVGLILPNVPEFAIVYYAILGVGAIVVPISTLLSESEAEFCLEDADARLAIVWADHEEQPREFPHRNTVVVRTGAYDAGGGRPPAIAVRGGDDTAVIIYTSGTTGRPKGAQLTHRNLARNSAAIVEATPIGRGTVALGALPLSHSFGQTWLLNATLGAGGCVSLLERFSGTAAAATIDEHRVTFFAGVPTMFAQLLEAATDPGYNALDLCVSGGAPMPPPLMYEFEARFGCEVREGYGLSETSPLVTLNPSGSARRVGTVGVPIPGVEVMIAGDRGAAPTGELGEVLVRGHNIMKGYWNRPQATAEAITADGWFHTGDLGSLDEDGFLSIAGRKKEMVIRGGYNVYPREVEDVLRSHPAVAEAAVVGIADPLLGEEVGAAVRLHADSSCEVAELRRHARERLAAYKYPRMIWTVEQMPTGPTGKVLKRLIEVPADAKHGAPTSVLGSGPSG